MENNSLAITCEHEPTACAKNPWLEGGVGPGGLAGGAAAAGVGAAVGEALNGDKDKTAEDGDQPNVGKNLTDGDKAELGGVGSGTGTPPPPEDDSKQQNTDKSVQNLNQKQESAIRKIDNAIKNGLKDHDIAGTIKDMDGNPVPKKNGGSWDHMQEMQNTLRGLRNNADTLKNVNNPDAQAAYGRATEAINKIESALKGHGI
ncbi:polymorphic toxin type 28 domain-containing protein [Dickeya chrysanthemi]|nr:polymorphic toxin type 28 domain-containing protein [Dickeya chrysanthemi]WJM85405.1 polymorphic toxin type 28 domain-containing protein [Dickeya chrysanthemi]